MPEQPVTDILDKYRASISWIESIIPDIKPTCRIYEYLRLLELTVSEIAAGISTEKPKLLILEAAKQSFLLIRLHQKFSNRTDKAFVDKLRESIFGPIYTHEEEHGKGPARGTFGRDIESEFFMAIRAKNPDIVSFTGNDVVYHLKDYNFGVEVKRIHSLKKINALFIDGCRQIEVNNDVQYGFVALRFDKHAFFRDDNGNIGLTGMDKKTFTFRSEKACQNSAIFQSNTLLKLYGQSCLDIAQASYPKIKGVCVFSFLSGFIENTSLPFVAGQTACGKFMDLNGQSDGVFDRVMEEFDPADDTGNI